MKHPLERIIEERIKDAQESGELSNLSCSGKPLGSLDPTGEDVLNRVVQESGGKPAFVELNAKIQMLLKRLGEVEDPGRRRAIEQQLAAMRTEAAIERERGR